MKNSHHRIAAVLILLFAAANAFVGIASLPVDSHEVFVIQTAQEMHERGEWIVPYFHGTPRLTKPPLNYWLTRAIAAVAPGPFKVQPAYARFPSALSGVLLVIITIQIGRLLFSQNAGLLAGVIVTTSAGFLNYTHSARAEMLYAMLCSGAILCFVKAWIAERDHRRSSAWSHAQWVFIGLAVLAKGPHLPAFIFVGAALFLWRQRVSWRAAIRLLQPITGVVFGVAIPLIWFILLDRRLRDLGMNGLIDTQLSGTLYRAAWARGLLPYYFVAYPSLFLPWIFAFPCLYWLRRSPYPQEAWLLMLMIMATLIPLDFAVQGHAYYALPLLAPGAVLLAAGMVAAVNAFAKRASLPSWWRWSPGVHVGLTVSLLILAAIKSNLTIVLAVLVMACILAMCFITLRKELRSNLPAARPIRTAIFCMGIASFTITATQILWSRARYERVDAALEAKEFSSVGSVVIAIGASDELLAYYTGRKVVSCSNRDELINALKKAPRQTAVVVIEKKYMDILDGPITWFVVDDSGTGDEVVVSASLNSTQPSSRGVVAAQAS